MRLRKSTSRFMTILLLGAGLCLPLQAESVLRFPRLTNQSGTLLGVTFVNPTDQAATLDLVAYDANGLLIAGDGITNPAQLEVAANQQRGLLVVDIFGLGLPADTVGWFEARSDIDGITGFYLFLDAAGTFLDGADLPRTETRIIFNRVEVDNEAGVTTELNIVNTSDYTAQIYLTLVDEALNGDEDPNNDSLQVVLPNVPPHAVRRVDVGSRFGLGKIGPSAYVVANSTDPVSSSVPARILGFEVVREAGKDAIGLNARTEAERFNRLFFPQLAVLGPFQMEIGVVNRSLRAVNAVFTAFRPDGKPYGAPQVTQNRVVRQIPAEFPFQANVEELFGFVGESALDGWILVESAEEALNGYVSYGLPGTGADAAVAVAAAPQTEALISHIASTSGFFTGVAALNPAAVVASFRIVALTAAGQILGSADLVLGPGQRISQLIEQYIPEAAGQAGGIIWIRSDSPLYLTALFGLGSLRVLSNIPAQDVLPSYRPDADLPGLRVTPRLAVLRPEEQRQFDASVANGPAEVDWSISPAEGGTIDGGGLFTAPEAPVDGPVTVQAEDSELGIRAAATVDVLERTPVDTELTDIRALTYSSFSDRVFVAVPAVAVAGGQENTRILAVTTEGIGEIITLPEQPVRSMIPFESFDGLEFLLLAGGDRVIRLGLESLETRIVETGFLGIQGMTYDSVNHNLMVADAAGLSLLAGSQIEPDRVSELDANGSPTLRLLDYAGIGDVAFDPCSAGFYFSSPGSGEVYRFDPGESEAQVISGNLAGVERLLLLERRGQSCRQSGHLLAGTDGGSQLSLIELASGDTQDWQPVDSAGSMAFLPAESSLAETAKVLIAEGGALQQAGTGMGGLVQVAVPNLYQAGPVNPGAVPRRGIHTDAVWDTFGLSATVLDAVEFSLTRTETELTVRLTLTQPVVPCEDPCNNPVLRPEDALRGFIELDLDQDPSTGGVSFIDPQSPHTTGLGVEFCLDLGTYDTPSETILALRVVDDETEVAGEVSMEIAGNTAIIHVPLELLEDDGFVNAAVILGPPVEPTDTVPNGGSVSSIAVRSNN